MSNAFFNIEMLPAKQGDSLFIEYGKDRTRRMVIDGGPLTGYQAFEKRLGEIPMGDQSVELLVITHVDTDHVEGVIRLMAMPESKWPIQVEQIWFNGWRHIEQARNLGGLEGEFMSALIHNRANDRWNTAFNGKAVRCGALPPNDKVQIADGMKLTLLSPDADALAALLKDWRAKLVGTDVDPGDLEDAWDALVEESKFHPGAKLTLGPEDLTAKLRKLLTGGDDSTANGSSIAFLAEFAGKSCMFLGDAHMNVICNSLKRLGWSKVNPAKVDAVKVSHHGSKNNLTPEFLKLVDAKHWLFSSNGYKFHHPSEETVEAITKSSLSRPTLWFNYRSPYTVKWEQDGKGTNARYRAEYPAKGEEGIVVKL